MRAASAIDAGDASERTFDACARLRLRGPTVAREPKLTGAADMMLDRSCSQEAEGSVDVPGLVLVKVRATPGFWP